LKITDKAFDTKLLAIAGYKMFDEREIGLARNLMNTEDNWTLKNIGVRDAKDGRQDGNLKVGISKYSLENTKLAGQAVLQFREYESKLKDANNAAGENETNQMLLDHGKVIYNSIVNNVESTVNLGIDLIRSNNGQNPAALVDPNRPRVNLSGIKMDYRSEMMRRDINGKLDGNGLKRGDFTEGAVTILAPLVVGKISSPIKAPNTLKSLGALPEVTSIPKTLPKIGKLEFEPNAKVSPAELKTANKLVGEGKDVKVLKEVENQKGVRTPDFEIDGVRTELKTVENLKKVDADSLSSNVSRKILDAGGQAKNIILDVSGQSGMTKEIAERGVLRAFGNLRRRGSDTVKEVRVFGKDFDTTILFKAKNK
jgi:hypothetical protein